MENKHKQFKPYDRVLVRDVFDKWHCDFYSHWNEAKKDHTTVRIIAVADSRILPYEGNEHLAGTISEPDEEIELKGGEWVMAKTDNKNWVLAKYQEYSELPWNNIEVEFFNGNVISVDEIILFPDFNPNDMEETRKHILCVKNGKIVKYHGKD